MKNYVERTETVTRKWVDNVTCDLCGRKSRDCNNWIASNTWGCDVNFSETEIKLREGYNGVDGGNGIEYEIDLCPDCFKSRLVVWLKEQGATIQEKEWDW